MSFGLRNAAQTFQRFMNEVLRDLEFCYAYIDDILVASSSDEGHEEHLCTMFGRLQEYGVVINPAKPEMEFFGYLVSGQETRLLPGRVEIVREYPMPKTAKDLRRYLGIVNFYRRFLPRTAETLAPLNDLLQGNTKRKTQIAWTPQARQAFEDSKEGIAQAALLAHTRTDARLALLPMPPNIASERRCNSEMTLIGNHWRFSQKN